MKGMKRTVVWLFERLHHVIIFLVGLLVSTFLKSVSPTPGTALFDVVLIVFAALSITTLLYLRIQISKEVDRSRLTVRFHPKSPEAEGDAEIYDPIISRIREAKRSVRVLGSMREPKAKSSSARQRYFNEIEGVIKKKINEGNSFVYERLVQVDFGNSSRSDSSYRQMTTLLSSTVDQLTYEHCEKVVKQAENSGKVQVFLRQTSSVMPMITLVLIDESYVILCLPWLERDGINELDTQQLGKGFIFHDFNSGLFSEMSAMFNVATHHSPPIYEFIDDRSSAISSVGDATSDAAPQVE